MPIIIAGKNNFRLRFLAIEVEIRDWNWVNQQECNIPLTSNLRYNLLVTS